MRTIVENSHRNEYVVSYMFCNRNETWYGSCEEGHHRDRPYCLDIGKAQDNAMVSMETNGATPLGSYMCVEGVAQHNNAQQDSGQGSNDNKEVVSSRVMSRKVNGGRGEDRGEMQVYSSN